MQVVYLGFFETLGEILSGIFNEVLAPILLVVLKSLVPILINAFLNLFAEVIFELEIAILKIIDFLTAPRQPGQDAPLRGDRVLLLPGRPRVLRRC